MATKYKIKRSDFWYVSYIDTAGRRVQKSLGTKNKEIAEEKRREIEQDLARGRLNLPVRSRHSSLTAAVDEYLTVCRANHADRTYVADKAAMGQFRAFAEGRGVSSLPEVTLQLLEEFKIHRRATVSQASVNHDIKVVKTFVNRMVAERKLPESPFRDPAGKNLLKKLVVVKKPPRFFEMEEISRLLSTESRPRWRAIITVALNTGLRKGEIQNLTWDKSIDFTNRQILVVEDGSFRPKGRRIRSVPMTESCEAALRGLDRRGRYVFGVRGDKPFINNFNKQFSEILTRAKIQGGSPHTLRHTFAAHLCMAGVPLRTVADYLGHSETDVTELYGNLSPHHRNSAIRALPYASISGSEGTPDQTRS